MEPKKTAIARECAGCGAEIEADAFAWRHVEVNLWFHRWACYYRWADQEPVVVPARVAREWSI